MAVFWCMACRTCTTFHVKKKKNKSKTKYETIINAFIDQNTLYQNTLDASSMISI